MSTTAGPVDVSALADLVTPYAVRIAATLGVADILADGPLPATTLALKCGAHPDRLTRLLRHLVLRGVFRETEPEVFGLNEAAETLKSDHPGVLREWLDLEGGLGRADLAFPHLLGTVRSGANAYREAAGEDFRTTLDTDPRFRDSFNQVMAAKSKELARQIVARYDWTTVRHVADVGGGMGILLGELLSAVPHLRGTLVDLPETAEAALGSLGARGVAERCRVHGGSFFDPLPTGADVMLVYDVLEDWDDDRARLLLSRCAEAVEPDGRILIIEPFPFDESYWPRFTDLDLRLLTYTDGRMRTEEETRALVRGAGMRVARIVPVSAAHAIVECVAG
ncbi:methyltransferase [Amycolatopsis pigmentata]|uniref:Methyltransferase n=1 Tax=Amycolatopsis pigmentata TaxID=450801 RepID=A0ABW5FUG8_9PSEU